MDVRVIAATNRDLTKEIENGHFREDLYYRLSVFCIPLPPLRERVEDIEVYTRAFVQYFGAKMKKKGLEVHPDYMECLKRYGWHGNVRELRNVVERSIVIAGEGQLTVDDLPLELRRPVPAAGETGGFSDFDMANIEKNHIRRVLQHTGGNKTEAARLMRIGLTTLYRKIEEYGLGDK